MNTTSVTIGSPKEYKPEADKLTSIVIKYPEGYINTKHFKNGDIKEVAKETAAQFIAAGFASLLTDSEALIIPIEQPVVDEEFGFVLGNDSVDLVANAADEVQEDENIKEVEKPKVKKVK